MDATTLIQTTCGIVSAAVAIASLVLALRAQNVGHLNLQKRILNETQVLKSLRTVDASYTAREESRVRLDKAIEKIGRRNRADPLIRYTILAGWGTVVGIIGLELTGTDQTWQIVLSLVFIGISLVAQVFVVVLLVTVFRVYWRNVELWIRSRWHARRRFFPPTKAPRARRTGSHQRRLSNSRRI